MISNKINLTNKTNKTQESRGKEMGFLFIIGFIFVWIIPMMKEANEDAKYRSYNASIGRKTYWSSTGERYVSDNRKVGK